MLQSPCFWVNCLKNSDPKSSVYLGKFVTAIPTIIAGFGRTVRVVIIYADFIPLSHLHLHVLTRCDGNNDYYSKEKAVVQVQLFLLKTFLSHREERSRAKTLDSVCWNGQPQSHHFPTWVKTVGGSILIKLKSHPIPHPNIQWEFHNPKIQVLYYIDAYCWPYFVRIFPHIALT